MASYSMHGLAVSMLIPAPIQQRQWSEESGGRTSSPISRVLAVLISHAGCYHTKHWLGKWDRSRAGGDELVYKHKPCFPPHFTLFVFWLFQYKKYPFGGGGWFAIGEKVRCPYCVAIVFYLLIRNLSKLSLALLLPLFYKKSK